ncbi:TetR/AcrR family transcriptional regulator [uncultured Albimonas sp.]|uniref:TetR/AcrR family transcriptional regulator n=1 Tax=uncultured Albimonas sp. TaxID=1331701 RepID=UPI0030EB5EC3
MENHADAPDAETDVETERAPRRLAKHEVTRARILDSAAQVFHDKGLAESKLAEIARGAGLHAGALYYHFSSRDDLVEQVLNEATYRMEDIMDRVFSELPDDATVIDKIRAAIAAHLDYVHRGDPFVKAYRRIYDQVPAEVRARHDRFEKRYGVFWRRLVAEGQACGELRADIEPGLARMLLLGAIEYTQTWYTPAGRLPLDALIEGATRFILTALDKRAEVE